MIEVETWVDKTHPRGSRGSAWIAQTIVNGQLFSARSRSGAPNELARQLVAAGIADQTMEIFNTDRGIKTLNYRSFHEAARWTYEENSSTPLHRVRWEDPTVKRARIAGAFAPKQG